MRLNWLAEAAAETGYPVIEVDGWENRGYSDSYSPTTVVAHHTAGPSTGDMPSLGIIVNGRSDLAGPLANYGLGRSGSIYVVASGKANNAGEGGWAGCSSNYCTIGIEAENDGHQPWPDTQLDSYGRLCAAILARLGRGSDRLCGHKEWAPSRKVDPHDLNMEKARTAVGSLLEGDEMTWTKPGDPIRDVKDADLALAYQGGFLSPGPTQGQASYNPGSDAELNDRIWIVIARIADWSMSIDQRLRKGGL